MPSRGASSERWRARRRRTSGSPAVSGRRRFRTASSSRSFPSSRCSSPCSSSSCPRRRSRDVVSWLVGVASLPDELGQSVDAAVEDAGPPASVTGVVALAGLIWAASGMMASVRSAFRAVWGSEADRPYLRGKLLDLVLVLGAGVLVVVCVRALTRRPGGHGDEQRDRGRSSAVGSPRRPASVRSRSSAPRSRWPCSPSRFSTGRSARCRCASGTSYRARSWPPWACIWRAPDSRSTSPASAASTTSMGRSARYSRSCCWCMRPPRSCCSARALLLPGQKQRPSRTRLDGEPLSLRTRLVARRARARDSRPRAERANAIDPFGS